MIIIAQTSCAPAEPEPISREEFLLDTICSISIYEMGDADAPKKTKKEAESASMKPLRFAGISMIH